MLLESAGVPLPGETALLLAAVYAGATGQLDITIVIACAAIAAILGDNFGYWVGRQFGVKLLERYGRYIHLTRSRLALGQYLFAKHGGKIVFFGRFIAFMRVFAALLAGANKYAWGPFLAYNAAGGIVWALVMGLGAYLFGNTTEPGSAGRSASSGSAWRPSASSPASFGCAIMRKRWRRACRRPPIVS